MAPMPTHVWMFRIIPMIGSPHSSLGLLPLADRAIARWALVLNVPPAVCFALHSASPFSLATLILAFARFFFPLCHPSLTKHQASPRRALSKTYSSPEPCSGPSHRVSNNSPTALQELAAGKPARNRNAYRLNPATNKHGSSVSFRFGCHQVLGTPKL